MALKTFKPTSAGLRHVVIVDRSELHKGKPVKELTEGLKKSGGNREIWRWLAATVLCLLFIESFLAKRFGDFTR